MLYFVEYKLHYWLYDPVLSYAPITEENLPRWNLMEQLWQGLYSWSKGP